MSEWFTVDNKADSESAEILIFNEIGGDGFYSKDFAEAFSRIPLTKEITVGINSIGGAVFEGLAIYNLINTRREKVTMRVDGAAVSIASIIACAGRKTVMAENALLMIHDPSVGIRGDADALRAKAGALDKIRDQLVGIYQRKTGKPESEIREAMAKETWFTAREAKAFGFCDEIIAPSTVKADFDFSQFKNGPTRPPVDSPQGGMANDKSESFFAGLKRWIGETENNELATARAELAGALQKINELTSGLTDAEAKLSDAASKIEQADTSIKAKDLEIAELRAQYESASKQAQKQLEAIGAQPPVSTDAPKNPVGEKTFAQLVAEKVSGGMKKADAVIACVREFPKAHQEAVSKRQINSL